MEPALRTLPFMFPRVSPKGHRAGQKHLRETKIPSPGHFFKRFASKLNLRRYAIPSIFDTIVTKNRCLPILFEGLAQRGLQMTEIEVIQCPQCGGSLESVNQPGYYSCPYCKSRMRFQVYEPDPGTRADGRRTVYDRDTGGELCYVKLARGWNAVGFVENRMQSANWPFCMHILAESPDHDARIHYCSGASFKESVSGMMQPHIEGGFDKAEMMPMLRRRTPENYADAYMAGDVPPGTALTLLETRPLPRFPAEDEAARRQGVFQDTVSVLQAKTPPGMRSAVDDAFYGGTTRIFAFEENGAAMRQAVATVISGVKISLGAPMIFGKLAVSIFWDVHYVLTLRARADIFEKQYGNLIMFCSSMQASPAVATRIIDERNRILGYLADRQQNEFEAHQRAMREQQAAFDSYNAAWHTRSDESYRASRASYAAKQASEDRMSDMQSEATRGVNTYIRPDGTEVEYSVINESAFASATDSRDTFATQSKAFESIDWVEMKKKY